MKRIVFAVLASLLAAVGAVEGWNPSMTARGDLEHRNNSRGVDAGPDRKIRAAYRSEATLYAGLVVALAA